MTHQFLPELVSGRWQREALTEGEWDGFSPSTTACGGGPPPRDKLGEELN